MKLPAHTSHASEDFGPCTFEESFFPFSIENLFLTIEGPCVYEVSGPGCTICCCKVWKEWQITLAMAVMVWEIIQLTKICVFLGLGSMSLVMFYVL